MIWGAGLLLLTTACGKSSRERSVHGIDLLNQNKPEAALKQLERAVKSPPPPEQAAEIWNAFGLAMVRAGRGLMAESAFQAARDADPTAFAPACNLGEFLLREGRVAEAETLLRDIAAQHPQRTEPLELLGFHALKQENFASAKDWFQQALTRGENARALTGMALASYRPESPDASISLLRKAAALDPSLAAAHWNLASMLDAARLEPEAAAVHYESYLRLNPGDERAVQLRQRIQVMSERQATGAYTRPDPVRTEVELRLTEASRAASMGDRSTALQSCLRAHAIAARAHRLELRERALRAACALVPDSARAHYGLANLLREQNRPDEAQKSYGTAATLDPAWPDALREWVISTRQIGDTRLVREILQKAETSAVSPEILLQIGDLYSDPLRDRKEARRVYRLLIERFPDHPLAETAAERVEGGPASPAPQSAS